MVVPSARAPAAEGDELLRATTIAVVATNARLTKAQANKVAQMADDGLARAIRPAHGTGDGDTVFALATGTATGTASLNQIGGAAADALSRAIIRALMAAEGIHTASCNVNSYCELFPSRCTLPTRRDHDPRLALSEHDAAVIGLAGPATVPGMCYSAQILADYRKYVRHHGATVDLKEFVDLFWRRLTDASIKIPKAIEAPFADPQGDEEARIQAHVETFHRQEAARLEQELFKQRKRLADAERTLQSKATKAATESKRIATAKVEWALGKLGDLRRSDLIDDDSRIFPAHYAPVMVWENGRRVIKPMRYQCRLPGKPAFHDAKFPGTYNARRDNLEGYLARAVRPFARRHRARCVLRERQSARDGAARTRPARTAGERGAGVPAATAATDVGGVPVVALDGAWRTRPAVVRRDHRRTAAGDRGRRPRSMHHSDPTGERRCVAAARSIRSGRAAGDPRRPRTPVLRAPTGGVAAVTPFTPLVNPTAESPVACRHAKRCTKLIDVQRLRDTLAATLDTRRVARRVGVSAKEYLCALLRKQGAGNHPLVLLLSASLAR